MGNSADNRIRLPGDEEYWSTYDWGMKLEESFPGQDGYDFVSACEHNWEDVPVEVRDVEIQKLRCIHHGENDGGDWIWEVELLRGGKYIVTGGCDFTGWDCQSWVTWAPYPEVDEVALRATHDASVWAAEFMKIVRAGVEVDEGLMVAWFANAIENAKVKLNHD